MTLSPSLVRDFQKLLGRENVFTEREDLLSYAFDGAVLPPRAPSIVLMPPSVELLGEALRRAYEGGLALTARGAGTNLSGATIPEPGDSAVILTGKLNRILEINQNDLYAVCEPGVVTADLFRKAAETGLFYPPDPGSMEVSTLGGNVALNAGGLRGLKYGVTKDYLMGLEFFDWRGRLIKSGSRTVKCVSGYNLPGLMTASEGTLGVFSRLILKLLPAPSRTLSMTAVYNNVAEAAESVAGIIAGRVLPATLEFMDQKCLKAVEAASKIGLPTEAAAMLLIEVDGFYDEQVRGDAEKIRLICRKNGALAVDLPESQTERDRIWEARRGTLPALARLRPSVVLEDATVPRSRVPEMLEAVGRLALKHRLEVGTFGHAGDGNLHPTILCDRRDPKEFKRVEEMVDGIFEAALKLDGTLSGEHGIGVAKAKWMEKETNRATIEFSLALRGALDPSGLFNFGKKVV
ncbi:MAG: FAD-binding protein [Deltaproteobacteria bacterium]|jgi:glycolate oxidase|nr:FAD-binding protein [Deltaproteobacteria bacterium]